MRVAVLAYVGLRTAFTGDATQMRCTVRELRKLPGLDVAVTYYDDQGTVLTEDGAPAPHGWEEFANRFDAMHLFHLLPYRHQRLLPTLDRMPVLVTPIFWANWRRWWVGARNGYSRWRILKVVLARYCPGLRRNDLRQGCDVLLPNSWAEGECFRANHRLGRHVVSIPVPNAVDRGAALAPDARPDYIPFAEYAVCPGAFAHRKNQLGLIRAMRGTGTPIVFVGQALDSAADYWNRCRREADANMLFVGHKDNTQADYWAILGHARCAVLGSDCETPGIALLEAAAVGARPVVTAQGGTQEYYGLCAEYLDPVRPASIRHALRSAWVRGRLSPSEADSFARFTWEWAAQVTAQAYQIAPGCWRAKQRGAT